MTTEKNGFKPVWASQGESHFVKSLLKEKFTPWLVARVALKDWRNTWELLHKERSLWFYTSLLKDN